MSFTKSLFFCFVLTKIFVQIPKTRWSSGVLTSDLRNSYQLIYPSFIVKYFHRESARYLHDTPKCQVVVAFFFLKIGI